MGHIASGSLPSSFGAIKFVTQFTDIRNTVMLDFEATDRFILEQLTTHVPFIREVGEYLIHSGGKRLRPLIALLAAKACGYEGTLHINIATAVEFLHTATLLHDDVVDESSIRRGKQTVNAIWGNAASVLVGDFLISRVFQILVQADNPIVLQRFSDATNIIAEGEVLQLLHSKNPATTFEQYHQVIQYKTAKLFEISAQCAAIIAQANTTQELALTQYANHLGCGFQMIDDALDYCGDEAKLGKKVGDDLTEGKITLPIILALHNTNIRRKDKEQLIQIIRNDEPTTKQIESVIQLLTDSGAIKTTIQQAQAEIDKALNALQSLEKNPYTTALEQLTHFVMQREY